MRAFLSRYWQPALSGILLGITLLAQDFIPGAHLAIFVAYAPLWLFWLRCERYRDVLLGGWLAQALLSIIAFNWIAHTVAEFGEMPWALAIPVFGLFAALANLQIPLAGLISAKLFPSRKFTVGWRLFAFVVAQGIGERIFPMLFDWHLGYAWFYLRLPGFQFADVIGFAGLGTVTLVINGLIAYAIAVYPSSTLMKKDFSWARAVGLAIFLLAGVNALGWWREKELSAPDATVNALVVQANIGNRDKLRDDDPRYRGELVARHLRLTEKGLTEARARGQRVDFAVWAENAFPDVITELGSVESHFQALQDFLVQEKLTLLTGGYGFSDSARVTNAFFVIPPARSWRVASYNKTHLLAFGEYLPGAEIFPGLLDLLPAVANFAPGNGPAVLRAGELLVGPQICYEGLFDDFSRRSANLGAEILINLTNDSWYGAWQEPRQHLYLTLARAIETRRPLLRATNTGISSAVLANGKVLALSPIDQAWAGVFEIAYRRRPGPT
ncbi:MAG: apolipoprotein N-acyltransferase, partial [Proteobacteria bacterium]